MLGYFFYVFVVRDVEQHDEGEAREQFRYKIHRDEFVLLKFGSVTRLIHRYSLTLYVSIMSNLVKL